MTYAAPTARVGCTEPSVPLGWSFQLCDCPIGYLNNSQTGLGTSARAWVAAGA